MSVVKDIDYDSQLIEDILGFEEYDNVMFSVDDIDECFFFSFLNGNFVKEDNISIGSDNMFEEMVYILSNDGQLIKVSFLFSLEEEVFFNWVIIEDEFIIACVFYQFYLGFDNLVFLEFRLNDGQIYLLMIRFGISKSAFVNFFLIFEIGDYVNSSYVEMVKVFVFRFESSGIEGNIMVDGEYVDYGLI